VGPESMKFHYGRPTLIILLYAVFAAQGFQYIQAFRTAEHMINPFIMAVILVGLAFVAVLAHNFVSRTRIQIIGDTISEFNLKREIVQELVLDQNTTVTLRRKDTELEIKQGEKSIVVRNSLYGWKTFLEEVAKRTTIQSEKTT
jgi:hypothetical protein